MGADLRIRVHCPYCDKVLHINAEYAGKWGKCSGCGKPIEVPMIEEKKVELEKMPELQPISKTNGTQIRCEKCGAPMERSRKLNKGGNKTGFIGFALIFCSVLFIFSPITDIVGISLGIIGITLVILGMFPGRIKIMHCKRCGYFYEVL